MSHDELDLQTVTQMTFWFHQDPGHGWLQVSHALLTELKITKDITSFSYRDSKYAYLEEDLDLGTFLGALFQYLQLPYDKEVAQCFWREKVRVRYADPSPIRGLKPY
ncbi:hypothetical protein ABIE26_002997 [Pedobacter africanus]|uniref:hypothetical protein n=1 Tax=Pedobacter africanus TaxID=151894 RepID=UPI003391E2C5